MKSKKIYQIVVNIISWLFLGLFVTVLIITAVSNLNVIGGYKSLIVQSGSMEPTIMTGDVIIIAKAPTYLKNEVITFIDNEDQLTTHRIAEVTTVGSQAQYGTKGDANRDQDNDNVARSQVLGKVILTVPKLGYFLTFVRSPVGLVIFVGLPALLIIIDEIIKIIGAIKQKNVS